MSDLQEGHAMSGALSLNGIWDLTFAEGPPLLHPDHYLGPQVRGRRLLPARVPGPIHQVLLEAGLIEDPNLGLNSLRARWVEEQFWVYRHTFQAPEGALAERASLVFERLELDAVVMLNGEIIGAHANAFRPARFDVTGKLRPGENLLVVKISTGLHSAADKPAADYLRDYGPDYLTRHHWHRNPQYQNGWDWSPRLLNVGILGDVRLEWHAGPRLDQIAVFGLVSHDLTTAAVHVSAMLESGGEQPLPGVLRARIVETCQDATARITLPPGASRHEVALQLDHPQLWWPRGHGEQSRYTVEVELEAAGEVQRTTRRLGLRRLEIDQSPHPEEGRHFIITINNRPIFCKGANWVPADLLYSTVDEARTRALVDLAAGASFNLLRIWGGGVYADHALLEACDERGLMVWHDFIFACCKYPGDDPAFAAEVRREATYVVRELAHHPSLVVWCGNNEIEWGDWEWGFDDHGRTHPHYALFHHDLPLICRTENPATPYWTSSPFSPDQRRPNDPTVGDQHPWAVSLATPGGADWWEYRRYVDRFPNEGGVLGCSSPATLRQFLPEDERFLRSLTWDHHDNPFACQDIPPGELGHAYATVALWTGRDPMAMDWDEYAFASALCQAEGLQEYIANYRRRMFSSASAIFWMYNDSWPVTHGWTIVDYYLRRKLSYHPVRRAFQPVTVVVAEQGGVVTVYGVNDTPATWRGELRYGLFLLAGGLPHDERLSVELPANAATALASFPRAQWDRLGLTRSGAFAVLLDRDEPIAQHRLLLARFGELEFASPELELKVESGRLRAVADVFVWGLCLDVDGEAPLPDNCFDLLPGIPYTMPWPDGLGAPRAVRIGSRDVVPPR